ncbi:hypothetical protein K7X08_031508 [Anisodus acutangulus]|uniref:SEC7 domain-containing protein n=1 Tax=Anisodus acutangulus TaxID=402998 RepID=A0A9Q1MLS7_9SOLA|nr:hypothetical protein K7X08_031508 [Anisodus acutangulus]
MHSVVDAVTSCRFEAVGLDNEYSFNSKTENGTGTSEYDSQPLSGAFTSSASTGLNSVIDEGMVMSDNGKDYVPNNLHLMTEPYRVPCMVEIFHFLCSLLNVVEHIGMGPRANTTAFDEDVPLFALCLINSAIELGGPAIRSHPRLLSLVQDELFQNLMIFGLSMSSVILSTVCSIVLNLYQHLRTELKLQLEAFLSCVVLRLAQSCYGASYQQQEVAMEAPVDFCRQKSFMSAFPVNSLLSAMNILALDGLIAVIQGMAERISNGGRSQQNPINLEEYAPFWMVKCESCSDPDHWVPFVRRRKHIKRRLIIGADHFNRDPKKGLEFLQGTYLLPEKLDPQSVACFFRFTAGLDKNLVGDFLGNPDEFCIQVLHEFAGTFDFEDMNLDIALRLFLETFRLPGESQKIARILEAFSERYYEQSPQILANKDAALLLSYSLIMLNTDQHNVQVKKKMTEEAFIRNNRSIMEKTSPYIVCDSRAYLDHDMFAIVFDHAEHEDVYKTCIDGFLAVAKISACHHLEDVLDDLVVSLCKFTTLLNPSLVEEPVLAFGDDAKARMATVTVFTIATEYGDFIRTGWRNILDCILRLHKLGLLPARVASDAVDDSNAPSDTGGHGKSLSNSLSSAHMQSIGRPQKGSSSPEDEDTAVFCLELLIAITLNNRDRIRLLWQGVYEHIASIVHSTVMPCALIEKAIFGLLRICLRLLPYKENLADELLRSLKLVLKLDARVADAYCEQITQEQDIQKLLKRDSMPWFSLCLMEPICPQLIMFFASRQQEILQSRVGPADRPSRAVDLMAGSVASLARWSKDTREALTETEAVPRYRRDVAEAFTRAEERDHEIYLPNGLWLQCFDMVIFTMLDNLIELASQKDFRNMEETLVLSLKLLMNVFHQLLHELFQLTTFCKLWLGVLNRMEKCMKVKVRGKKSEKIQELVPELLKNTLAVMKSKGVLAKMSALGGDSLWELTWLHVNNIVPSLQSEVFPDNDSENVQPDPVSAETNPNE